MGKGVVVFFSIERDVFGCMIDDDVVIIIIYYFI